MSIAAPTDQLYQVGNCVVFATWCAIQPALHDSQRGIYGGYISLNMGIGFLFAALLGFADGKGYLSHDQTWAILIALQVRNPTLLSPSPLATPERWPVLHSCR